MIWLTVVLGGLISIVALLYVLAPLLRPGPATRLVDDDRLTDLVGRKDAVVRSIKELEFDYHVGKLNEVDYQRLNERLRRQAIVLLQQIEKLAPATATMDEQLEAQIAALRKTQDRRIAPKESPVAVGANGSRAEPGEADEMAGEHDVREPQDMATPEPAAPSRASMADGRGRRTRFCTNCGHPVEATHKFCANCGTPVAQVAEASQ